MRRCRKTGAAGRGQRQGRRQAQRESKRVACAGTAQAGDGASGTVNGSVVVASLVVEVKPGSAVDLALSSSQVKSSQVKSSQFGSLVGLCVSRAH